jgi:hypothetical protein
MCIKLGHLREKNLQIGDPIDSGDYIAAMSLMQTCVGREETAWRVCTLEHEFIIRVLFIVTPVVHRAAFGLFHLASNCAAQYLDLLFGKAFNDDGRKWHE